MRGSSGGGSISSSSSSSSSSGGAASTPRRRLLHHHHLHLRALRVGGATLAAAAAMSAASAGGAAAGAGSSAGPRPPERVRRVLAWLDSRPAGKSPLTVSSCAMQYDAEPTVPLPDVVAGLTPRDCVPPPSPPQQEQAQEKAREHFGRVVAAALLAACGGLDAAHNLVTPLCWGSWTSYAGAPVANSAAAADAALVHAITHRQEGCCDGEFGSGFSNANYWYRAAGDHPVLRRLLPAAQEAARGCAAAEKHVASHGAQWQPTRFVALCADIAEEERSSSRSRNHRQEPGFEGGGDAAALRRFCERVMRAELQLLLDHVYAKLG